MKPNIRLKIILLENNLRQRDLAFGTGISEDRISQAIRYSKTNSEIREKISRFLGIPEAELFPQE
jgi:transcriptional regulator with XRE-family HTH domain